MCSRRFPEQAREPRPQQNRDSPLRLESRTADLVLGFPFCLSIQCGVRSQESGVRSQKSGVRRLNSRLRTPDSALPTPHSALRTFFNHSYLNAIIGSVLVARRAGMKQAANDTTSIAKPIATNVVGPVGLTLNSRAVINRVSPKAPINPAVIPIIVINIPCFTTSF